MSDPNRRSQSCEATLTIQGVVYQGSTGKDHGHAEMDALWYFIMAEREGITTPKQAIAHCANLINTPGIAKVVSCPSRDICLQCATVLKKLGFTLAPGSAWGKQTMGSTEWGVAQPVRELFKARGIHYQEILELR